ncbi:hypothetical protein GCM10022248_57800 [Nonomuraea soli]
MATAQAAFRATGRPAAPASAGPAIAPSTAAAASAVRNAELTLPSRPAAVVRCSQVYSATGTRAPGTPTRKAAAIAGPLTMARKARATRAWAVAIRGRAGKRSTSLALIGAPTRKPRPRADSR